MSEQYDDKLMKDHDYDGIQELDNDLPRWWLWLFYLCIIWSVLYMGYYHVLALGYSSDEEYRSELDPEYVRVIDQPRGLVAWFGAYRAPYYDPLRDQALRRTTGGGRLAIATRDNDTTTYVALTDSEALAAGSTIFAAKCAQCHGKLGEGGIGPNLTDDYWLHGAGIANVAKTIKFGVPTKGMISWRGDLTPEQIVQAASYILTLHGSNPPNAKAPQGELVSQ